VLVLVIVLAATNLVSLGVLVRYLLKPVEHPEPDARVRSYLAEQRPAVSTSGTRRVITIEILNPIELAGKRGRLAGLAGSLAPSITRRVVYDQAMRLVRRHLASEKVVADVRLSVIRAEEPPAVVTFDPPPHVPPMHLDSTDQEPEADASG
jgi:hypothetical protein